VQQNSLKYSQIIRSMDVQSRALRDELNFVLDKTKKLEGDLAVNLRENRELSLRLKNFDELNNSLKEQLARIKDERESILKEIESTKARTDELKSSKDSLEAKIQESAGQTQTIISNLEDRVVQLNAKLEEKTRQLEKASLAMTSTRIININKDSQFVIVNSGLENGYKKGMRLSVLRGTKAVGEVEVIEVRQNVSACDAKTDLDNLRVGDEVRIQ
jgi:chromosome segregation ATPase